MTQGVRVYGDWRDEPDWDRLVKALLLLAESLAASSNATGSEPKATDGGPVEDGDAA